MTYPMYVEFGAGKVLLHTIAEILAFIAGYQYFRFLRNRKGDRLSDVNRSWILVGAIFGALIGSRILGGLENPPQILAAKNIFLNFYENKTVVGGFLGGLFGVELIKKIIGEKKPSGSLFVKPILLALIIGRIGCFSMGVFEETYGLPASVPWGLNLGDGILRHPVALYEIGFLILLWLIISRLERIFEPGEGVTFKIFMIAYLLFRFSLDFIKPHYDIIPGLSVIQLACVGGLIYYRNDIRFMNKMFIKPIKVNG
ncbi:MAG TPA: prolipoprotein diacylglyceryl transferase family protein [Puia sp.]|nr:prolipoprotein diacylglyceryl transferase family protein [Puia sp.]